MNMRPPGLIKKEDDDKQQMMATSQPMGMVHPHPGMTTMGISRGPHHPLHSSDPQMGHHGIPVHPSTSAPNHPPPEMMNEIKVILLKIFIFLIEKGPTVDSTGICLFLDDRYTLN